MNEYQMSNKNKKKDTKQVRKVIRTCIHQPFEYNFRSLDQHQSLELAQLIETMKSDKEVSQQIKISIGIKSCIRQLRSNRENVLYVILILDQSLMEVMLQAATIFWKYQAQPILAKEESRVYLKKYLKIDKVNCISFICQKGGLSNELKQRITPVLHQLTYFQNESKYVTLKPVKVLHHVQIKEVPTNQNTKPQQQNKQVRLNEQTEPNNNNETNADINTIVQEPQPIKQLPVPQIQNTEQVEIEQQQPQQDPVQNVNQE